VIGLGTMTKIIAFFGFGEPWFWQPLAMTAHGNTVEQYRSALCNLHSQTLVDAQSNFVPNRVLGTTPPELSSFECYLSRSVRTTLAQLRSGHSTLTRSASLQA